MKLIVNSTGANCVTFLHTILKSATFSKNIILEKNNCFRRSEHSIEKKTNVMGSQALSSFYKRFNFSKRTFMCRYAANKRNHI